MKVIKEKHVGFAANITSSHQFRVKNDEHLFEILTDKIYNDKHSALLRESAANAYDAHVEANNIDTRFKIWLPRKNGDEFRIRDYGAAMSREFIIERYTTFGDSTRRESNDQIGKYGLGAKVALAVSKLVTVTSYLNGRKYIFVFDTTNSCIPTAREMTPVEGIKTDQPNGVEISLIVKEDGHNYYNKAKTIFEAYPEHLLPIDGHTGEVFKLDEKTWDFEQNKDYKFSNNNYNKYDKNIKVVMGTVSYPVNTSKIDYDFYSKFGNYCELWMYVDIGSIEIGAGREEVKYIPLTINTIKNRLDDIHTKITAKLQSKLTNCNTNLEFLIAVNKANNFRQFLQSANYNNSNYNQIIAKACDIAQQADVRIVSKGYGRVNKYTLDKTNSWRTKEYMIDRWLKNIGDKDKYKILYKDSIDYLARINNEYANDNINMIFVFEDETLCKEFSDYLGVSYDKTSDMQKPPKLSKNSSAKLSKVFKFDPTASATQSSSARSCYWEEAEIDFNKDSGLYVEINNYLINKTREPSDFKALIKLYDTLLGYSSNITVYGVKTSSIKALKRGKGKWSDAYEFLNDEVKRLLNKNGIFKKYKVYNDNYAYLYNRQYYRDNVKIYRSLVKKGFSNQHLIIKIVDKFNSEIKLGEEYKTKYVEGNGHRQIEAIIEKQYKDELEKTTIEYNELIDKAKTKYRMLKYHGDIDLDDLYEYILNIDELNKLKTHKQNRINSQCKLGV